MEPINKNILLAGDIVGNRWKIEEKIGEGTFSQIYAAHAIDTGQRVAVKAEAPTSLKPVLEWESAILKNLQSCGHVCRYYYFGKHAESTVLVMELLGESMSMLRISPDASQGISVTKCVSVGLEMLDCIEAFHSHGYVHRDIKASNFASSLSFTSSKRKYYIIDFGLSRQYRCDGKIVPARKKADFRGTSMYASLSAHRRQELSPKDDLWSWLYLLLDFMRGELPWSLDAQQKNRQIVLELKEYYTEKKPELLVDGLVGAQHLLAIISYFLSLKYEDSVNYDFIRSTLLKFLTVHEPQEDVSDEWEKLNSDADRALLWASKVEEFLTKKEPPTVFESFYNVAKRFQTFFDCSELKKEEFSRVQQNVYRVEQLIMQTQLPSPPPIQSFSKRRQSEQKLRDEGMKKRRERERKIRQDIEQRILKATRQVNSLGDVNASIESSIVSKSDQNGDTYSAIEQARESDSALSPNGHILRVMDSRHPSDRAVLQENPSFNAHRGNQNVHSPYERSEFRTRSRSRSQVQFQPKKRPRPRFQSQSHYRSQPGPPSWSRSRSRSNHRSSSGSGSSRSNSNSRFHRPLARNTYRYSRKSNSRHSPSLRHKLHSRNETNRREAVRNDLT